MRHHDADLLNVWRRRRESCPQGAAVPRLEIGLPSAAEAFAVAVADDQVFLLVPRIDEVNSADRTVVAALLRVAEIVTESEAFVAFIHHRELQHQGVAARTLQLGYV